jgi:D-alanyl-lipoteichoic acid acyltransferase DltB (MBOAT superfamily)
MLFNSIGFAIFLPIVFFLYWFASKDNLKHQNLLLIIASYFFYACWDWRFLFLLIFSTLLDFYSGSKIANSDKIQQKRFWLFLSIIINLGFLGIFKYYNFFAGSFIDALSYLGIKADYNSINVILPVGISFYTFHGLSYVLDIFNGKIKPEKNFINYSLFVSFFPLLVAGPIERATHLLPQIVKKREFEYSKAVDGLRQIVWGLFKKIVIADNCAGLANEIFNNSGNYSGSTLVLGAVFFSFQIYCDFSGYSDIALGTARLFGIELLRNFAFPYFSRNIAEFWRRWHISLTTWFRDYLYIPLGGSRGSIWMKVRNTFIIFILSGFWHGANWTFIFWGALNAVYFLPLLLTKNNRNYMEIVAKGKMAPTLKEVSLMIVTFGLTTFAWIFFRAENIGHAFRYISGILSPTLFTLPVFASMGKALMTILFIIIFVLVEWKGREGEYAISRIGFRWRPSLRYAMYGTLILTILYFGGEKQQFIYFQF